MTIESVTIRVCPNFNLKATILISAFHFPHLAICTLAFCRALEDKQE